MPTTPPPSCTAGAIHFRPCHSTTAVGPMTGLITPHMPLLVVENRQHGNRAYCTLNEGLGKVSTVWRQ